jgi:hypothetical protein
MKKRLIASRPASSSASNASWGFRIIAAALSTSASQAAIDLARRRREASLPAQAIGNMLAFDPPLAAAASLSRFG